MDNEQNMAVRDLVPGLLISIREIGVRPALIVGISTPIGGAMRSMILSDPETGVELEKTYWLNVDREVIVHEPATEQQASS